jgi:hypothetical protein
MLLLAPVIYQHQHGFQILHHQAKATELIRHLNLSFQLKICQQQVLNLEME